MRPCPNCSEFIGERLDLCPLCGHEIEPFVESAASKSTSWTDVGIVGTFRRNAVVIALAILVLAVVGINILVPRSLPDDPLEAALRLHKLGMDAWAAASLEESILDLQNNDSASLDLAYVHIQSYFAAYPDDDGSHIRLIYGTLIGRSGAVKNVGCYGWGLINSIMGQYDDALVFFERVSDEDQKYLNNSMGYVHLELGNDEQAEACFWREIELDGNVPAAVGNLATLYLRASRFEDARELIENDLTGPYVPDLARIELARRTGRIGRYLFISLLSPWKYVQIDGVLAALVICATWFIYLWRIDVFKHKPLRFTLGALVLGGLTSVLTWTLYDLVSLVSPFSAGSDKWSELLYYVLHVGLIEEIVKFIPVLVIVPLFRHVDEPLDMVIYGSLTALGFATTENSLYLTGYGLGAGYGRFVISTMLHISLTGTICYAWAKARYIKKRNPVLPVLLSLVIAAVLHGLFDFSLVNQDWHPALWFVYIGLIPFFAVSYARMLMRALYHSPFRDVYSAHSDRLRNHSLLFSTVLILLLIAFLQDNFTCATGVANVRLCTAFIDPLCPYALVLFIFGVLGRLTAKLPVPLSGWLSPRRRR